FTSEVAKVSIEDNHNLVKEISEQEIADIIVVLPNNKAPGKDGLPYEFYKEMRDECSKVLTKYKILLLAKTTKKWLTILFSFKNKTALGIIYWLSSN
ncbi:12459_t:CDS:2, partial [Gigaspora rosea]